MIHACYGAVGFANVPSYHSTDGIPLSLNRVWRDLQPSCFDAIRGPLPEQVLLLLLGFPRPHHSKQRLVHPGLPLPDGRSGLGSRTNRAGQERSRRI